MISFAKNISFVSSSFEFVAFIFSNAIGPVNWKTYKIKTEPIVAQEMKIE